jgi:hypothetical protein
MFRNRWTFSSGIGGNFAAVYALKAVADHIHAKCPYFRYQLKHRTLDENPSATLVFSDYQVTAKSPNLPFNSRFIDIYQIF